MILYRKDGKKITVDKGQYDLMLKAGYTAKAPKAEAEAPKASVTAKVAK